MARVEEVLLEALAVEEAALLEAEVAAEAAAEDLVHRAVTLAVIGGEDAATSGGAAAAAVGVVLDQEVGIEMSMNRGDLSTRKSYPHHIPISALILSLPRFSAGGEQLEQPAADVEQRENALIRPGEEISLSGLSLDDLPLPSRPSYGTKGRPVVLRTNYFKLLTRPGAEIYRYEMDINPKILVANARDDKPRPNRRKTRRLIELLIQSNPNLQGVATDYSKFLVTAKKLPVGQSGSMKLSQKFWEPEDDGPGPQAKTYEVTISNVYAMPIQQLLDYLSSPPGVTSAGFDKGEVIQALNLILTRTANENRNIYGGGNRNKFYTYPTEDKWFDLGSGLIALKGFYTSVRTSTLRILVNVNVANAAFYPAINLLGLMRLHTPNRNNDSKSGLEAFISRLKVSHSYIRKNKNDPKSVIKRVKTVLGFSHPKQKLPLLGNAHQIRFACEELKGTVSVVEYFQRSKRDAHVNVEKRH